MALFQPLVGEYFDQGEVLLFEVQELVVDPVVDEIGEVLVVNLVVVYPFEIRDIFVDYFLDFIGGEVLD